MNGIVHIEEGETTQHEGDAVEEERDIPDIKTRRAGGANGRKEAKTLKNRKSSSYQNSERSDRYY